MIINFLILTAIIITLLIFYIYMQYFHGSVTHTGSIPEEKSPIIVFDFDGVLCDSYQNVISVINENAGTYHYLPLEKNPEIYKNMDSSELFGAMKINRIKLPFLVKIWRKSLENKMSGVKPFNGMADLISWLKAHHVSIGIVTSNSIKNVEFFLSKMDLINLILFTRAREYSRKIKYFMTLLINRTINPKTFITLAMKQEISKLERKQVSILFQSLGDFRLNQY